MEIKCYKFTPTELKFCGVIDDPVSFMFCRKYSGIGDWQIVQSLDTVNATRISDFDFIQIAPRVAGIVTKVITDKGTSNKRTIKGIELKGIAKQRIVMPPAGSAELSYSNAAVNKVIEGLFTTQIVSPADTDRAIPLTRVIPLASDVLTKIYYSGRFADLYEDLSNISAAGGVGWYADIAEGHINLSCMAGLDRTAGQQANQRLILSLDNNRLDSLYVDKNTRWVNIGYVAGQGEGMQRTVITRSVNNDTSGLGRYEAYIDARDIYTVDELKSRGDEKLAEYGDNITVTATMSKSFAVQYGTAFDLGDIATIKDDALPTGTLDARITEIETVCEGGEQTISATLGYNKTQINDVLNRLKNNKSINAR